MAPLRDPPPLRNHGVVRNLVAPLVAALLAAPSGCAAAPAPCATSAACPGDLVCQVGRCSPLARLPVDAAARRLLLEPTAFVWVDGTSDEASPAELRLRSAVGGAALALVRFDLSTVKGSLDRAYLLLEPIDDAPPTPEPVEVGVSWLLDPWGDDAAHGKLPRSSPPGAAGLVTIAPPTPVRIDVTEMLRDALAPGAAQRHGLLVHAAGGPRGTLGARLATPASGGPGVRLDLYLR